MQIIYKLESISKYAVISIFLGWANISYRITKQIGKSNDD